MNPLVLMTLVLGYFLMLIIISRLIYKKTDDNEAFFKANKSAPWYLVAFGMIGASLSGVTFISVPGKVEVSQFVYFQMVLGYILGYLVIGLVLMPMYYKLQLTTIYTYLKTRFGEFSYKTGAWFFIISRTVGSNLRLMLVADVLQTLIFSPLGVPYWVTVTLTIILIWVYTFQSGIKTIVFTDTLQTMFMLISVGVSIYVVSSDLGLNLSNFASFVSESSFSKTFFFDNPQAPEFFWKQFFAGTFMAIAMTGLDQDMMQKNLTCKNLKEAQKNMLWFTVVLVIVNFAFLIMGLLFTEYAIQFGINAHKDQLFPILANEYLGLGVAFFFTIGIIAAAYSSADSALTSLTTSFCIDILNIEERYDVKNQVKTRKFVHKGFVVVSVVIILFFKYLVADDSVIDKVFQFAALTYGPLLGLYAYGLFTKCQVIDKLVPFIALTSVVFSYLLSQYSMVWFGFKFGFELLIINGGITFLGLWLTHLIKSQKKFKAVT